MIRVLHVTSTYRPAIGGIETVIESLCRVLRESGIRSEVAHVAPGLKPSSDIVDGTTVHRLPLYGHPFIGLAPNLATLIRQFDVVHMHDPHFLSLTASLILFGGRTAAVCSTHGGFRHTDSLATLKTLHERLTLPLFLRRYRRVLASSKTDLEWVAGYSANAVLAENGVDVRGFASISASPARNCWKWIYWGRLSVNKRVGDIVDLAEHARSLGYPVLLTICGADFDGSGVTVRKRVEHATGDWIKLESAASQDYLMELIAESGVFISASEYEGFGLTAIEAMAAGLPVICRDIAPLRDFIDQSCGIRLSYTGDDKDFGRFDAFLVRLAEDYETLSAAARARATQYDWTGAVLPFVGAYRETLGRAELPGFAGGQ